jgi:type VI secretion system protein ImpN
MPDVRDGMTALLLGLEAIHAAGYVHCDISPANLLLPGNDYRRLKIADFGVALERGQRHRDLDIVKAATPLFTAPELSEGGHADSRADLYSAGCVMNALLDRCDGLGDEADALRALAQHLSQPDPSKRPASAIEALALLDR